MCLINSVLPSCLENSLKKVVEIFGSCVGKGLSLHPLSPPKGRGPEGAGTDGGAQFFDKVGETRKENEREENRKEKMDGGARVKDNSKKRHIWSEDTHYHEEFDPGSG